MKETFIAYQGREFSDREIEDALLEANNNYDYTVKVIHAGGDGETVFGKIVFDSYAKQNRDPQAGGTIVNVGGYDLELLHSMVQGIAGGRYNPQDRDQDHRVTRQLFEDFGPEAFAMMSRWMPVSAAFYDTATKKLVAGRTEDTGSQESYANLFYGKDAAGGMIFSNNEEILHKFVTDVFPVAPFTYYTDGKFVQYREEEKKVSSDEGIKASYTNARDLIGLINGLLTQSAHESLHTIIDKAFHSYFDSVDATKKVSDFVTGNLDTELRKQVAGVIDERIASLSTEQKIDEHLDAKYRQLLDEFLGKTATPQVKVITLNELPLVKTGVHYFHDKFEQVLTQIQLDEPVMLVGPAGSGKNHAASQVAEGLGLKMYYTNNASNEFKLTGFIDAGGTYHETEFYRAFKNGGLFFLDEIDNSDPSALIVINSALANGYMAFPNETIKRHPDFRCIAAANTWGKGSNLQYVGRNILDGATLDRFDMVFFDYDRRLEQALYPSEDLLEFMWSLRNSVNECRISHIVSTRGIGKCYKKERYGMEIDTILRTNVVRGLSQDDMNTAIGAMVDIMEKNRYLRAVKALRIDQ